MLIYLSDDVVKGYDKNTLENHQSSIIDEILSSHTLGTHFVYGSGQVLRYFSTSGKVSERTRTIYKSIYHNRPTIEPYLQSINHKIIVNIQDPIIKRKGNFEVEVNLDFFRLTNSLQRVLIISEDIEDCNFYGSITERLKLINSDLLKLTYETVNGGGDRTADNFDEKAIDKKYITYTILDSDKKFEGDTTGNTYNKVLKKFNEKDEETLAKLHLLTVHEKENLISPIIYSTLNVDKQVVKILSEISINEDVVNFLKYLDLKEGLHSLNYHSYYDNLVNFLIDNNLLGNTFGTFNGTLADLHTELNKIKKLTKEKREAAKFFIIKPLSSNPLNRFDINKQILTCRNNLSITKNAYEREKNKKKLSLLINFDKALLEFQKDDINKITSDIFELTLAYNNKILI